MFLSLSYKAFDVLNQLRLKAGLNTAETASILDISEPAFYRHLANLGTGISVLGYKADKNVQVTLSVLSTLLKDKQLPLPERLSKVDRRVTVKGIRRLVSRFYPIASEVTKVNALREAVKYMAKEG